MLDLAYKFKASGTQYPNIKPRSLFSYASIQIQVYSSYCFVLYLIHKFLTPSHRGPVSDRSTVPRSSDRVLFSPSRSPARPRPNLLTFSSFPARTRGTKGRRKMISTPPPSPVDFRAVMNPSQLPQC